MQLNDIAHTFAPESRDSYCHFNSVLAHCLAFASTSVTSVVIHRRIALLGLPVRESTFIRCRRPDHWHRHATPASHPTSILVDPEPGFTRIQDTTSEYRYPVICLSKWIPGPNSFDRHGWTTSVKTESQYHIHPDDPTSPLVWTWQQRKPMVAVVNRIIFSWTRFSWTPA